MNPINSTELPVIDQSELIDRMMGSAQMAERMLDKFLTASARDCDELESIIRMGNADAIASLAHRHKGTARTMAARRVAEVASELETRATTDPTSELLGLLNQLRAAHEEVREFSKTGLECHRSPGDQR